MWVIWEILNASTLWSEVGTYLTESDADEMLAWLRGKFPDGIFLKGVKMWNPGEKCGVKESPRS